MVSLFLNRKDIDKNYIVAYGESLGGAVAIDLSTKKPVKALIVESSFTWMKDMAKLAAPIVPGFMLNTKMDSINKVKKIDVPKLFIHSLEDEIIPLRIGKRLYDSAKEPKGFLQITGGHNDGFNKSKNEFYQGIGYFLQEQGFL